MNQYVSPQSHTEHQAHEREAAFRQYDGMVSQVLNDLKSAVFPRSYQVDKHNAGEWYLSPPQHVMSISPVSVKLRFDSRDRPVAFRVTNYVDWAPIEECELSSDALNHTVRKLFPRFHKS